MKRREVLRGLGGALAAPMTAYAQPGAKRRIGLLMGYRENDLEAQVWFRAFKEALEAFGWVTGRNLQLDSRWMTTGVDQFRSDAAELLALRPDVVLATSTPVVAELQKQNKTVPVIFLNVADPVSQGFVSNPARPENNITGFSTFEFSMGGKWVQTLKEAFPGISKVAAFFQPETAPYSSSFLDAIKQAAVSSSVEIIETRIRDANGIGPAINELAHIPDCAIIVIPSILFTSNRQQIITGAAAHRIPTIYPWRSFTLGGGLMSYGTVVSDQFRRAAGYADRLFRGEKLQNLPVQPPAKFELLINLKTAKEMGFDLPSLFVARADAVVE